MTNFNFINADQWTNYPAFGIGNIPVLVSNQFVYSSAVNRLLQLAANMYDATTNNFGWAIIIRPSSARRFGSPTKMATMMFTSMAINKSSRCRWEQVIRNCMRRVDVTALAFGLQGSTAINYPYGINVYGVPWIIGAKKGFPNFNKFSMQNVVQITRKLQIRRSKIPTTSVSDFVFTNQLYAFNISNSIGIDCWNSYTNPYPNRCRLWSMTTFQ